MDAEREVLTRKHLEGLTPRGHMAATNERCCQRSFPRDSPTDRGPSFPQHRTHVAMSLRPVQVWTKVVLREHSLNKRLPSEDKASSSSLIAGQAESETGNKKKINGNVLQTCLNL